MLICTPEAREQFAIAQALPVTDEEDTFTGRLNYLNTYGARGEKYAAEVAVFLRHERAPQDAGRYFGLAWYKLEDSCPACGGSGCSSEYHQPGSACRAFDYEWREGVSEHRRGSCPSCFGSGRRHIRMFTGALVYHETSQTWGVHT